MKGYLFYDFEIKKIISIVFRFIILIDGIAVIASESNFFSLNIYKSACILYITFFFILFFKFKKYSYLRLINDSLFIGLTLYSKPLDSFINTSLLLLPLINSPNHSGSKRTRIVFLLNILTILIVTNLKVKTIYFIPIVLLAGLSILKRFRYTLNAFSNDIMSTIDTYNIHNYQFGHTYKIYRSIISHLDKSFYSKWCSVENIISFILRDREIILYDSADFIINFSINDADRVINDINIGKVINNVGINLDGNYKNIDFLKSVVFDREDTDGNKKKEVIFFCIILRNNKNPFRIFLADILLNTLTPLFIRIASLISMERELRLVRDEQVRNIKSKLNYVNNALLAIHFIRNKLSPVQNAIAMTLHRSTNKDPASTLSWNTLKTKDLLQSQNSLNEIHQKSNYLLESGNNPFKIGDLTKMSLQRLFFLVRRIWLQHFNINSIAVDIDVSTFKRSSFLLDTEAIEIVFTDIITNAAKYCSDKDLCSLQISEQDGNIKFNIINFQKDKFQLAAMLIISKTYNTKEFSITNKKTHGLKIVKEFLEQMDIDYLITVTDVRVNFQIIIKNIKYEGDSNI